MDRSERIITWQRVKEKEDIDTVGRAKEGRGNAFWPALLKRILRKKKSKIKENRRRGESAKK